MGLDVAFLYLTDPPESLSFPAKIFHFANLDFEVWIFHFRPRRPLRCAALLACLVFAFICLNLRADTLRDVHQRGVLLWGGDEEGGAPYSYPDPKNPDKMIGFEFELADEIAGKLGVKARMVQNQWDQLVPALERRNFDIILNGLEITPENLQRISMSSPYYVYTQQIVTRKGASGLESLEHLRGREIAALSASAAQRLLEKFGGIKVHIYPGNVEALRDLKAGRIEAVVLDLPIAIFYAKSDPELGFAGPPFAEGYYGIGIRRGDDALLGEINRIIAVLATDGTLERIYRKYGLWDERQENLKKFEAQPATEVQRISTLRQWRKYLPRLLRGAVMTIQLSLLAMAVAVVVGFFIVLVRLYTFPPFTWIARIYVEVMRGTPLLIQLFFIYYGLPELGIRLNPFLAGVLGLGLNYAANEAENYRAGIQSIPRSQSEAAFALGFTHWQTLRRIILPQALRVVIPPVTNDFIAMFKDSSIVSVITMVELTKAYGILAMATYDYIGLGLMTAAIYLAMSYPASLFAHWLERKLHHDHR
jgi:polar amino acid transport system substrate-binding protein